MGTPQEPGEDGQRSPWKGFVLRQGLVLLAAVGVGFATLVTANEKAIEGELLGRGRALFSSIVVARRWNAMHGGVLVPKTPGVAANPYLENPDRRGTDGTVYTLKNPALMTREISDIAEHEGAFKFHITSLKPLNPENAPDAFERTSLEAFERGVPETTGRQTLGGNPWFRYMAPLRVEASCLTCHAKQGYQIGQIRGGISVSFGMADAEAAIRWSRIVGLVGFLLTSAVLVLLGWWMITGLRRQVSSAEQRVRELALTDELTGLPNRRQTAERLRDEVARSVRYGRPLAVAMLDVDHFKAVNDTHGHEAGDIVLEAVARAGQSGLRGSDLLGRWGGEEFLLILPETGAAGARVLVERVRAAVAALEVVSRGRRIRVTLSGGIAAWEPTGDSPSAVDSDVLLREADDALYRAKGAGRNRVEG